MRIGGDPGPCRIQQFRGRNSLLHDAHATCGRGIDAPRFQHERQCIHGPDHARQALRAAGAGYQPNLCFRKSDPAIGIIGHNAMMTGERDFQPAAQCGAVDRSHDRLAAGFEFAEHAMDAHHGVERSFGVCLASARKGCHLVQIGAGTEISGFRAGDDEPFDGGVR